MNWKKLEVLVIYKAGDFNNHLRCCFCYTNFEMLLAPTPPSVPHGFLDTLIFKSSQIIHCGLITGVRQRFHDE